MDLGFVLGMMLGNLFGWGIVLPLVVFKRKPRWIDFFLGLCFGFMSVMAMAWIMSAKINVPEAWERFF